MSTLAPLPAATVHALPPRWVQGSFLRFLAAKGRVLSITPLSSGAIVTYFWADQLLFAEQKAGTVGCDDSNTRLAPTASTTRVQAVSGFASFPGLLCDLPKSKQL